MDREKTVNKMVSSFNNISGGFPAYQDEMNRISNARQAEIYYLQKVANACNDVLEHCSSVAESLEKASENIKNVKSSLFGDLDIKEVEHD